VRKSKLKSSATDVTPRRRRRRIVEGVLVAVGCVVLLDALAGERGLMELRRARAQTRAYEERLARVLAENEELRDEIRRLDTDEATIEGRARELGLIKRGEKVFTIRQAPPPEP
jgi:cell division protein FtsB